MEDLQNRIADASDQGLMSTDENVVPFLLRFVLGEFHYGQRATAHYGLVRSDLVEPEFRDNFCMGIDVEPCSSPRSSPKCSLRHLLVIIIAGLLCSISLLSIIIFRLLNRSILYQSHFLTSPKLINIGGTLRINWCYNISYWCAVLS